MVFLGSGSAGGSLLVLVLVMVFFQRIIWFGFCGLVFYFFSLVLTMVFWLKTRFFRPQNWKTMVFVPKTRLFELTDDGFWFGFSFIFCSLLVTVLVLVFCLWSSKGLIWFWLFNLELRVIWYGSGFLSKKFEKPTGITNLVQFGLPSLH